MKVIICCTPNPRSNKFLKKLDLISRQGRWVRRSYRALSGTRTSQQLIWEWNPGVLFNFHVPSFNQHHHPNSFFLQLYLTLAMLGKCNFCARFRRRASCLTWTCQVLKHCFILPLWVRICLFHLSVPATKMITVTNLNACVCCWKIW